MKLMGTVYSLEQVTSLEDPYVQYEEASYSSYRSSESTQSKKAN